MTALEQTQEGLSRLLGRAGSSVAADHHERSHVHTAEAGDDPLPTATHPVQDEKTAKWKRKRFLLVAGAVAVVLTGVGVAFNHWTTTTMGAGTGTGTGGTGAIGTNTAFTATQNSTQAGLVPGGAAQGLDFTVTNPVSADIWITNVNITVNSTSNAGCTAADFAVVQPSKPSVATPVRIAGSSSTSFTSGAGGEQAFTGASLRVLNRAVNQDLCKNVTINLAYAVG